MKKSAKLKKKDAIHKTIREICLIRHPYCVICKKSDGILQGGHLIPKKRSEAVRYSLDNVFTQCSSCNFKHNQNPHPYIQWYLKEYGQENYDSLVERSKLIVKHKDWELDEIHDTLKQILHQMRNK